MRKERLVNKRIKYHYDNPESQKLFEEFSILLADITKYIENKDIQIVSKGEEMQKVQRKYEEINKELEKVQVKYEEINKELEKVQVNYEKNKNKLKQVESQHKEALAKLELMNSGRFMIKALFKKTVYFVYRYITYIPRIIMNKFKNTFK